MADGLCVTGSFPDWSPSGERECLELEVCHGHGVRRAARDDERVLLMIHGARVPDVQPVPVQLQLFGSLVTYG